MTSSQPSPSASQQAATASTSAAVATSTNSSAPIKLFGEMGNSMVSILAAMAAAAAANKPANNQAHSNHPFGPFAAAAAAASSNSSPDTLLNQQQAATAAALAAFKYNSLLNQAATAAAAAAAAASAPSSIAKYMACYYNKPVEYIQRLLEANAAVNSASTSSVAPASCPISDFYYAAGSGQELLMMQQQQQQQSSGNSRFHPYTKNESAGSKLTARAGNFKASSKPPAIDSISFLSSPTPRPNSAQPQSSLDNHSPPSPH